MSKPCVCVTGSTQGIGLAIAEAFARKGARLAINSHLPDTQAKARLDALTECHFIQSDLAKPGGAQYLVDEAHRALGRLDTLVNNAGTFLDGEFLNLSEETFDRTFNLNVKAYLFAAQAFVRHLAPSQEGASIICVGSTNSVSAEPGSVIYDASKGAVAMLVKSLAVSLAGRGVRVNGVGPGIIETELTRTGLGRPNVRATLDRKIPLGRVGVPSDVGEAAVFLASEAARYITGQMLFVDGGILAIQNTWEPPA